MTTEELLLALPQPIVIVGNGVPSGQLGERIDAFASVIRMNNYVLDGFADLVGSRTVLRCTSCWTDIEHRDVPEFTPFHADARPESSNLAAYRQAVPHKSIASAHLDVRSKAVPLGILKPSTGLALLMLCDAMGLQVTGVGFDGFVSGHYWAPGTTWKNAHDACEATMISAFKKVVLL